MTKPEHYNSHPSGVEVIELTSLLPFCEGNAVKYVLRRDLKVNPVQDLEKAEFYLNYTIQKGVLTPDYRITPKMISLAMTLITHEADPLVNSFLAALCVPLVHDEDAGGAIYSAIPDLRRALKCVRALLKEVRG